LDALEASGQWDNTVVVFTSDHGEMGGSHGLAHKAPTMYEENIHVPLWIADPRQVKGFRQCPALASNMDLAPTLAALAGLTWPTPLPGRDLSPALAGSDAVGNDHVFCEGSPRRDATWRGLRTPEWKYWHYDNGEELLFNLTRDPLELANLAADPAAASTLSSMRDKVRAWRRDTHDPINGFM